MNLTFKRFASFLMALVMIFSLLPSFETHVHAEEHPEEPAVQYTVKFLDADGTELQTILVEEGAMPAYTGAPLLKEGYAFVGWTPEIAAAAADAEYTAVYTEAQPIEEEPEIPSEPEIPQEPETKEYTITFLDWDDSLLGTLTAEEGEVLDLKGAEPLRNGDGRYIYKFAGWDVNGNGVYEENVDVLPAVTADATYKAVYYQADDYGISLAALSVEGLTVSGAESAEGTTITATATGWWLFGNQTSTTTVTLTNNSGSQATLTFAYSLQNGGSMKIGSESVTSGNYSAVLENGSKITITITSKAGSGNKTTATFENIKLTPVQSSIQTIYKAAPNGSYTVDGTAVGADGYTGNKGTTESYAVKATPATGYQFFGWYNETTGKYLSYNAEDSLTITEAATIYPEFISTNAAIFGVGADRFHDLTKADAAATNGAVKQINLLNNGTLSGSHTISSGNTLLIPYNDANTAYGANAKCTSSIANNVDWVKPTQFRVLTMASGATITVNGGAIEVGGQHAADNGGGPYCGAPTGPLGWIKMESGSNITLNSGASLYSWGYIQGSGTITAKSKSKVYENFQFTDFRGGTNLDDLGEENLVFPINQYYVQNIEVPTTYEYGAEEHIYTSIYASYMCAGSSIKFMGTGGMFVPAEGSTVTKDYIESRDRMQVDITGSASLNSLQLKNLPVVGDVDSSTYVLSLTNNIIININSGITTLNQGVALLPGVEMTIAKNATLSIAPGGKLNAYNTNGINLIVYDYDEWTYGYDDYATTGTNKVTGNYAFSNRRFRPVGYAPGRTYNRTEAKDLKDAMINVNGYIIADGFLYTTAGGAEIKSTEKTGTIAMNKGAGVDTWTFQTNAGTAIGIPMKSAALRNGDGTYLETAGAEAGTSYHYCGTHDCWYTGECEACNPTVKYTITFLNEDGSAFKTIQVKEGATPDPETFPTKAGDKQYASYTFAGWDLAVNGAYDGKADTVAAATADATYKAIFTPGALMTYNVIFKDTDGKTLYTAENVAYGNKPNYEGITTKTVNCTTYTISVPQVAAVNGEAATLSYTVSWTEGETKHTEVTVDGKAPTCEETGLTNGTKCSVCGTTLTEQTEIPALKHDMKLTAEQVDAKCEVAGKTAVYTCANGCGKTEGGEEIPALKHDMKLTAEQVDAKCEVAGKTAVYTCANNCGKTEGGDEIPALKHDMKLTTAKVEAECEKAGQEAIYTCANGCGKTEGGEEIPALEHDMKLTSEQVDAKCEVAGKTAVYTCANNCGKTEGGEEIPALKHNMQLTSEKVDAKCEVAGKEAVYTCANNCGKTEGGEEIPALKHDMKLTSEQVDAKCEVAGKTAVYTCANGCGKTEGGEEIPALKHDMKLTAEQVDAKCEVAGKTAIYTCANGCGKTEGGEEIPALKHDMKLTTAKVEAECEKAGQEAIYTCANGCGKTEGGEEIPALKHSYAVTYRNDGETHTKIETCSNDATHVIETAGQAHEYVNGECECGAKEPVPAGLKGDLDLDGDVDAFDLTLLAQHVAGIEELTGQALENADVDTSGDVSAEDMTVHAGYIAGIITEWP